MSAIVSLSPILDLALTQANAQGAYIYRFEPETSGALLAASAGRTPEKTALEPAAVAVHRERKAPLVLHAQAASDWRFTGFPEFRDGWFEGVVSLPLVESGETLGVANFCWTVRAPLSPSVLSFLIGLSAPLSAVLAAAALRERLQKAHRELADRKLFERAKGMVQARFQWTEEESYLRIRRLSRRSRTPMRDLARLIVETGAEPLAEALEAHE